MPRFEKDVDGRTVTVETALKTEIAELRSRGFKEKAARTKAVREADSKTDNK